LNPSAWTIYVF